MMYVCSVNDRRLAPNKFPVVCIHCGVKAAVNQNLIPWNPIHFLCRMVVRSRKSKVIGDDRSEIHTYCQEISHFKTSQSRHPSRCHNMCCTFLSRNRLIHLWRHMNLSDQPDTIQC